MIIVLAGNYQQYMRYRKDNDLGPTDSIYVVDWRVLHGRVIREDDQIIEVGTFYERPDAVEIRALLETAKSKGRHPSNARKSSEPG